MPTNISGTTGIDKVQDGTVVNADIDTLDAGKLTGTVADARISALTASKLTGALPAISAANLTAIPAANITGTLPAIDGSSLTGITGRKNLFINGGFDVWQRGTSATHQLSYLADRWYNATSETQSRQTFTVGQTDVPHNPKYYRRGTTGSTEWYGLRQHIEDVSITAGREVTLSYWMKGSSAFTNAPFQSQNFGAGGSSGINTAITPTASITTSWARYTHTFTLASITGKTVGSGSYLKINLVRANVNNVTIDVANAQLEFGDTATDFEHRSYGEELALCQRYYEIGGYGAWAKREGSSSFVVQTEYKVEKRAIPTVIALQTSNVRFREFGVADRDASTMTLNSTTGSVNGGYMKVSGWSSLPSNTMAGVNYTTSDNTGDLFAFDAEL